MSETPTITPEQQKALEQATQEQLNKLANQSKQQEIDAAVVKAKEEAKKEFDLAQQLKEQSEQAKKLEAMLAEQKKQADAQLAEMKKRMDEMTTSKAKINFENPFLKQNSQSPQGGSVYDNLRNNPDLYSDVEEKARIAFFGR